MVGSGRRSAGALTVIDVIGRWSSSRMATPTARAPGVWSPKLTPHPRARGPPPGGLASVIGRSTDEARHVGVVEVSEDRLPGCAARGRNYETDFGRSANVVACSPPRRGRRFVHSRERSE